MGKKRRTLRVVVLDTNVIVFALLFKGKTAQLLNLWKQNLFVPLLCKDTFTELVKVLAYPKFSLTESEIKTIIAEEILPYFKIISLKSKITGVCDDPDDNKFIACAISGQSDFIVTGDKGLYKVKKYKTIKIIKVEDFLRLLKT